MARTACSACPLTIDAAGWPEGDAQAWIENSGAIWRPMGMVVRAPAAVLGQMNTDAVPTRATTTDPPSVMYARRDNARPARRSAKANATAINARRMAMAQQTRITARP